MIDVELLYFQGCPSWEHAWVELGRVVADLDLRVCLRVRDIAALDGPD